MSSMAARRMMVRKVPEPVKDERPEEVRLLEALLFASREPLDEKTLGARLPAGADLKSRAANSAAANTRRAASISSRSAANGHSAPRPIWRGC